VARITQRTRRNNPAIQNPGAPKPAPKPPIKTLQHYLDVVFAAERANLEPPTPVIGGFTVKSKDASISITLLDSAGNHQYAGIKDKDTGMHYSGSLPKVAALYAAYDLRAAARKHAKDNAFTTTPGFLTSFDSAVVTTGAVAKIQTAGHGLKPVLASIFTGFKATPPNQVDFTQGFQTELNKIDDSPSAGRVIRALGYAYINVSLMKGGFFNAATEKGIWLAGDYSGGTITDTVRMPVENDTVVGGSGQALTTEQMSRMFRLFHLGEAYPHVTDAAERGAANTGAHTILETHLSFFFDTRPGRQMHLTVAPDFTKDYGTPPDRRHCIKVGIGRLGPLVNGQPTGPSVFSEAAVFTWNNSAEKDAFNTSKVRSLTGEFILVWQNMYHSDPRWDALVRVVNTTIKNFLTQV
jgi:hypothetical protein